MKRSAPLQRRSLPRRTPLKATRRPQVTGPGREAWTAPQAGFCECGCGRYAEHLERHHLVERQRIRREKRFDLEWDLRNSLLLHPVCHSQHTSAFRRIPLSALPAVAWEFAREFLGDEAEIYLGRRYR